MPASSSQALSAPSEARQWVALLAAPLIALVVGLICLPAPKSVVVARKSYDRSALADIVADRAPSAAQSADVVFGDRIHLVGADLPSEPLTRGSTLKIKTHFKVESQLNRNWEMFVHMDRKSQQHRLHGDHWPTNNRYPTSLWQQGEYVTDAYSKIVPLDAPEGTYVVYIGFYIGDERLPVSRDGDKRHAGENRVRIGEFTVAK